MVREASALDIIPTKSEAAALALEAALIAETRPFYNVLLKEDDARYPYARITWSEPFPRVVVTRERRAARPGDRLFGPFVDEGMLKRLLHVLYEVFPLRQRARRLFLDRVCMNYDLGRCPGVCQGLVGPEEYRQTVEKVEKVLGGAVEEVVAEMRGEMKALAGEMRYEDAARVRDRVRLLQSVFQGGMRSAIVGGVEDAASVVSVDADVSRDVLCVAKGKEGGKVVLFQVRGGKVIGRMVFSVEGEDHVVEEEMLERAVAAHYAGVTHPIEVPEEVVLGIRVEGMEDIRRVLREKRGKKVTVRVGGGKLKPLMDIVQRNAQLEVELREKRVKNVGKEVRELEEMLTPYFVGLLKGRQEFMDEENAMLRLSRIEGYDISHTSGTNAVGSRVVFVNGVAVPSEYRRYNLDEKVSWEGHPDDYESIRQVLRRRFKNTESSFPSEASQSDMPDLLLIDGGKGQLSAAMDALNEMNLKDRLAIIGLAKGNEEIFVPGRTESINFDEDTQAWIMNGGVRLLCRIRDEAHRTAVESHRRRRGRQALRSGLDSVPGLGAVKRTSLLAYFNGSSEAVAEASVSDLQKAPGIGLALAQRIFDHFHQH